MRKTRLMMIAFALIYGSAFAATEQEITEAIESTYQLTTRSMFSGQVKKPGTVLYVRQPGIQANKPSTVLKATIIRNGEIDELGGGSIIPGSSGKTLDVGEEMYLYKVQAKDDFFVVFLGTVNSYEMQIGGSRKMQPYQLAMKFEYDGGLSSITSDDALNAVASFFATEKQLADSDDNTLKLGQTPDQVIAILGAPKTKVDLGSKLIYNYDNMKIIFTDGVVSDVQ